MFEKLAKPVSRSRSTRKVEIPLTQAFLCVIKAEGCRLSYAGLALASRVFLEDSSSQILGQRGATLVKSLPVELHPFVCQKSGGYNKAVFRKFTSCPEDLRDRPVIDETNVREAIEVYKKSSS